MIKTTRKWLSFIFEVKDMGKVRYMLGMEIVKKTFQEALWFVPTSIY